MMNVFQFLAGLRMSFKITFFWHVLNQQQSEGKNCFYFPEKQGSNVPAAGFGKQNVIGATSVTRAERKVSLPCWVYEGTSCLVLEQMPDLWSDGDWWIWERFFFPKSNGTLTFYWNTLGLSLWEANIFSLFWANEPSFNDYSCVQ